MLKLGTIIPALVLGLVMSLSLAATGVFAQSANPQTTSNGAQVAVTTTAFPGASTVVQHANVQQLGWTYRGPGGFSGHRGFYGGHRFYGYSGYRGYGGWGY